MDGVWFWSIWAFACAALGLLFAEPGVLEQGLGLGAAPAAVHLITAGVLAGGYFALQARVWGRVYRPTPWVHRLQWALWACWVAGAAALAGGLYRGHFALAYLGGHYLVPIAIVIAVAQGVVAYARRPAGAPRLPAAHLPGLGLLVVMALGVMLLIDRFGGQYGFYGGLPILLHMLSAAFLFVLPAQVLEAALLPPEGGDPGPPAADGSEDRTALRVIVWTAAAALGLLALALSARGWAAGAPVGLALLGAVGLWVGLPAGAERRQPTWESVRRFPWAAVGLLLLYGALQAWRGIPLSLAVPLAQIGVVLFLFALAMPDWFFRLTVGLAPARRGDAADAGERLALRAAVHYVIQQLGTVLLLIGLLAGATWLLQAGAVVWLAALGAAAAARLPRSRPAAG